jgi:hypothetical protein
MESTGVLPFVRGVDLSGNDFKVSRAGGGRIPAGFLGRQAARLSASGPAAAGTSGGAGWGSSAGLPARNRTPGLCSVPAPRDKARVQCHPGGPLETDPEPGSSAGWEGTQGHGAPAPTPDVTRPSLALTQAGRAAPAAQELM